MNLEKYVVVLKNVVPVVDFSNPDENQFDEICDSLKLAFGQYSESIGVGSETFIMELFDQHNSFPQKSSDFICLTNTSESEDLIIKLVSTEDVIRIVPGDVIFLPNHIIFDYVVNTKSQMENNLIAYFSLMGEEQ